MRFHSPSPIHCRWLSQHPGKHCCKWPSCQNISNPSFLPGNDLLFSGSLMRPGVVNVRDTSRPCTKCLATAVHPHGWFVLLPFHWTQHQCSTSTNGVYGRLPPTLSTERQWAAVSRIQQKKQNNKFLVWNCNDLETTCRFNQSPIVQSPCRTSCTSVQCIVHCRVKTSN